MREQKNKRGWLPIKKLNDRAKKSSPSKTSSYYQIKHSQLQTVLVILYLCVWWGFNAPNQPSHCKNHSLALPKMEQQSHKTRVVAGKNITFPVPRNTLLALWTKNYQGPLNDSNRSQSKTLALLKSMGDLPLLAQSQDFKSTFQSPPLLSTGSGDYFHLSSKQKLQKDRCSNKNVHNKRYLPKLSDLHINRLSAGCDIQECFCLKINYGSKQYVSKSPIRTQLHQAFERKDLKMYGKTDSSGIKG